MKLTDQERMTSAHFTGCEVADEHYHREDVERIVAARLAAVEAVLTRMECRSVDHRHPNEAGHWGVEGRAYYYAGDVIDDIYELRAAVAADPAVEVGLRGPGDRDARWRIVARDLRVPPAADTT